MVAVGGIFAIAVGKFLFGGLGSNAFNPALVGRAFLQAAFPQAMTHWSLPFVGDRFAEVPASILALPFMQPAYDAVTAATPLAEMKFDGIQAINHDLLFGLTPGSVGETCTVLIFLGGAYLVARRMMNWRIPASIFITVALISTAFAIYDPVIYPRSPFMLFSGGLMLGAMFMADHECRLLAVRFSHWWPRGRDPLLGRYARGCDVRNPAGKCRLAAYRPAHKTRGLRHRQEGGMNMQVPDQQPQTSAWSIYRAIVGIGALCALLIVTVYQTTAARISENKARFLAAAISEVLPAASSTVAIEISEDGRIEEATDAAALPGFFGYDASGRLVGAVVTAEGMGYQDNIRVLYAYSFELDAIVGFKILDSKETPGLGDRVEIEPHFIANFEKLDATQTDRHCCIRS